MPKPNSFFLPLLLLCLFLLPAARAQSSVATLEVRDAVVYVFYRFGALWAAAQNNSIVSPPILVYVYSRAPYIHIHSEYGRYVGTWGLALNISDVDFAKDVHISVGIENVTYTLVFRPVRALNITQPQPPGFPWETVKQWLDRHAQYAAIIASTAIVSAYTVKRKTLLLRTFNALNMLIIISTSLIIYYICIRTQQSEWLTAVFLPSYLISYKSIPVGRKVYLIKIIPSLRKILWETAVLYRTAEGWLAYAKQSVGEAFKRMLGKHIVVKDVEINKIGEFSEDKFWRVEDVETYESSDGMLVLDAEITRERVMLERGEEGVYREYAEEGK